MRTYARASVRNPDQERLIAEHIDMARRIALRVARRVPSWMSKDDLIATAYMGLAEAADRYSLERERPFVAFAEQRIRGAVLDALRRGDILPRALRTQARKVGRVIASLEQKLGRNPEDEEIAAELGVSVETYREELEGLTHAGFVEFSSASEAGDLASSDEHAPDFLMEKKALRERVLNALVCIPERDAKILSLYYVEELTYGEIGSLLGVSESRVCQLHARAMARLRAELDVPKPEKK